MQNPGGRVMMITNEKKVPSLELVRQCLPLLWNTLLSFFDVCCRPNLKSFYVCHAGKPWNGHFAYLSQLCKLNIRSRLWERQEDVTTGLLGLSAGVLQSSGAQPKDGLSALCLDAEVTTRGDAARGARQCLSLSLLCIWTPLLPCHWFCLCSDKDSLRHFALSFCALGALLHRDDSALTWQSLPGWGCPCCAGSSLSGPFLFRLLSVGSAAFGRCFDNGTGWMEQTPLQNRKLSLRSHKVSLNWHMHRWQIPSLKVCWEAVKIRIDFPVWKSD